MRTTLFIAAATLFFASCTDKAPLQIDLSGKPLLDTITASVFYYDTVTVTCGQTLVVNTENAYWFAFGNIDTTSIKYLWTTGDTTTSTTISNVPDNSVVHVGLHVTYKVTFSQWVNDSTYIDTTYYSSFDEEVIVRGRHLPLYLVPAGFTPNHDGMNEFFTITAICFSSCRLKVYDTFSRTLLFESTDINDGWDGTYKGKNMPSDEYIYNFEITSVNNQTTESEGYFQLVR